MDTVDSSFLYFSSNRFHFPVYIPHLQLSHITYLAQTNTIPNVNPKTLHDLTLAVKHSNHNR